MTSVQVGPELVEALKAWQNMLLNAEKSYMSASKYSFLCILFKAAHIRTQRYSIHVLHEKLPMKDFKIKFQYAQRHRNSRNPRTTGMEEQHDLIHEG